MFRWSACFLDRSRDQIVTPAAAVDKREHMIIRIALANHFDPAVALDTRQLTHHKRLLRAGTDRDQKYENDSLDH